MGEWEAASQASGARVQQAALILQIRQEEDLLTLHTSFRQNQKERRVKH